ncbi:hypothetical protein [Haloferula sp.]|uniref:hypothetical protein n=1 Tax=Haloferula sp. TaxID=2497595 RepID=UPI00329FA750
MNIPIRLLLFAALLYTGISGVLADGIAMTDDFHFKGKGNITIDLTESQIDQLEAARVKGELPFPTKLKLTQKQTEQIESATKKRVLEVNAFEGAYRCCSCCAQNIASRFLPGKLELSAAYLVDITNLRVFD